MATTLPKKKQQTELRNEKELVNTFYGSLLMLSEPKIKLGMEIERNKIWFTVAYECKMKIKNCFIGASLELSVIKKNIK